MGFGCVRGGVGCIMGRVRVVWICPPREVFFGCYAIYKVLSRRDFTARCINSSLLISFHSVEF